LKISSRITIFIILFAIAGAIVGLIGISYWSEGVAGFNSVKTDPNPDLIRSWFPYFQTYVVAGILFILGGLGYIVSTFFLWNRDLKGKTIALYSGGAIVIAWGVVQNLSMHFRNPPPFGSLLVGLLALYLLTKDFSSHLSNTHS